ncbi:MAG: FliA/WhiG family RNA polymerase sigma factor [Acidobacteria bacterium]|nr:MAG: FliA/WhiG family RNA polymerase sigma factor [Acidobacteriota bacterium]PYS16205.1 MAG: FliA/WhiG family RNA polymerase sigma factor [Acidobacteriota bacterium]
MTPAERDALINETLPLIKHIAHRVATRLPSNIEMRDLINAGVLGLMDAIEKFEPERNVKFKTYAEVRIRGAILDSLRDLDWAPRSLRKKSKDLEKIYSDLSQKLGRPATDEEISEAMGEDIEDFHALVDQLHGLTIGSFENLSDSDDSESYINYYPDDGSNDPYAKFESNELTRLLAGAIDELPEKERLVLSLYYYEEFTMKEIGALLGVNESRVSQLHTKATLRLRGRLAKLVPDVDSMLRTSVTG